MSDVDLNAEAFGEAHVYQQGAGTQVNATHVHFEYGSTGQPPRLAQLEACPLVSQTNPVEIGVHRSTPSAGRALPPYVRRSVDPRIRAELQNAELAGGFLVLVGDSTSGKSRTAFEAIRELFPDWKLFAPDSLQEIIDAVLALAASPSRYIVWLDDLERFLRGGGFTSGLLRELKRARHVVVGTIRTEHYEAVVHPIASKAAAVGDQHQHGLTNAARVIEQASLVVLERLWNHSELQRAAESRDRRLAEATRHGDRFGVAEYLAAGPALYTDWQLAWSAGVAPRGAALVAAAVDLERCGLPVPVPRDAVEQLHEEYLAARGGKLLRPEPLEVALAWATQARHGVASLLTATDDDTGLSAFDYLPGAVRREGREVPDGTWDVVRELVAQKPAQSHDVALAALNSGKFEFAERALIEALEAGNAESALSLARLLASQNRWSERVTVLRKGAQLGNSEASVQLGVMLEEQGSTDEAETILREAAELGDAHAAHHLAMLLRGTGRLEEAEAVYRAQGEASAPNAVYGLAQILAEAGRFEEALTWLEREALGGNSNAACAAADLYFRQRNLPKAEELLATAGAAESPEGMVLLGRIRAEQGRREEAEAVYRRALKRHYPPAYTGLASLLTSDDRGEEALELLRDAAPFGDSDVLVALGRLRCKEGDLDGALEAFRSAAMGGEARAFGMLADALASEERADEANGFYERAADLGDRHAAFAFGRSLLEIDRVRAVAYLRLAAESGEAIPLCELAGAVYVESPDEALQLLRRSMALGHAHAGCSLGALLLRAEPDEAIAALEWAFEHGHEHAGEVIGRHFVRSGRVSEGVAWLKRAGSPLAPRDHQASRPRQRAKGAKGGHRRKR